MKGPAAPKDAEEKKPSFYIMRGKQIAGAPVSEDKGVQFIYLNDGRLLSSAKLVGNISDENIMELLKTTEGFRKLVYAIGISVEAQDMDQNVDFVFQMYGKTDMYGGGTNVKVTVKADGMEKIVKLSECEWSDDDKEPGQIRFEFAKPGIQAIAAVRFYLNDGYTAPEPEEEKEVDFESSVYAEMLDKSIMQTGNNTRIKKAIEKARNGEDVTIAFIGGSITQGAGAVPINTKCYAYKTFENFCKYLGKSTDENIHFVKAGIGGTPSELGMIRYERDVLRYGNVTPDIVVVEFAVNDAGDETSGECYDSLVRKIYMSENKPAVILLFSVFADDYNLQDRLKVVGETYKLPMVSLKNCVTEQFYKKAEEGRLISKNQYFYDCFHPTNTGHVIMSDCLMHVIKAIDDLEADDSDFDISNIKAPHGDEFAGVRLIDKKEINDNRVSVVSNVSCGDFSDTDELLQTAEMDTDLHGTKQFPYNWMHKKGNKPFEMDIKCSALLMINKDSGEPDAGCAEVYVDGEKVLFVDPKVVGWTHCNPLICFRGRENKVYHVEVRMQPGDEDKDFTILGFGYVE